MEKVRTLQHTAVTPAFVLSLTAERSGQWSMDRLRKAASEQLHRHEASLPELTRDIDHAVRRLVATGDAERVRPGVYRFRRR